MEKAVRDVMVDQGQCIVVKPQDRIKEVIMAFGTMGFGTCEKDCVALVKDGPRLVGMVTIMDLLEVIEPAFLKGENTCEAFWSGLFTQRCRNVAEKRVGEFMRPPVVVSPDDTLMKLASLINRYHADVIPVMNGDCLVGLARAADVFKHIGEAVG